MPASAAAVAVGASQPAPAARGLPTATLAAHEPGNRPMQRGLIGPLALLACLAAIGVVVAAFASGGTPSRPSVNVAQAQHTQAQARGHQPAHHSRTRLARRAPSSLAANPTPKRTTPPSSTTGASPPATPASTSTSTPAATSTSTPADVVQAFYEASARHDYASAWRLADENMRTQLDGFDSFEAEMSAVRTITFHQAQTVQENSSSATVSLDTTAVLLDRTQHCTGTVQTVLTAPGQWMLDHIAISCAAV